MENQKTEIMLNESKSLIKRFFTPKIIFGLLTLVIVVEIIFAIRAITSPSSTLAPFAQPKQINQNIVALISDKKEYKVGDNISVRVVIKTDHETAGTDAILRFDPKILETSASSIEKGTIYQEYPGLQVDLNKGLINISGIIGFGQPNFTGSGVLATVTFKAKAAGNTTVTLVFQPGSTIDTNIVDATSSEDVLEKVGGLNLVIK